MPRVEITVGAPEANRWPQIGQPTDERHHAKPRISHPQPHRQETHGHQHRSTQHRQPAAQAATRVLHRSDPQTGLRILVAVDPGDGNRMRELPEVKQAKQGPGEIVQRRIGHRSTNQHGQCAGNRSDRQLPDRTSLKGRVAGHVKEPIDDCQSGDPDCRRRQQKHHASERKGQSEGQRALG